MVLTVTEITTSTEAVSDTVTGTSRRRFIVHVRGTTTLNSDTLDLSNALRNISGVEAPLAETYNGAVSATSSTFSGTTITFAGHTGAGLYTGSWIVYE